MENKEFMDEFFTQVGYMWINYILRKWKWTFEDHNWVISVCVLQIEEIRSSIDKIDENIAEIKRLYSVILSAPTSDQS